jgi:AraC-like DNA-binding protein
MLSYPAMTPLFQPFPMLGGRRAQAWRYHPAYRRPRHVHDESEINLVVAGTGVMSVGSREIRLEAGVLLWLPPGLDHALESASADFDLVVAGFERELLDSVLRERGKLPRFTARVGHVGSDAGALAARLLQGAEGTDARDVEANLLEALTSLDGPAESATVGERAAELLWSEGALGRDQLARRLGINRGDLSRHFCRENGLPIAEYRNRQRLMAFLAEAGQTPGNLMRAAHAAGFGSYSQCHRVFHQLLGSSPRDYLLGGGVDPDRFEPWSAQ